jgi:ABC-type Mn2+/Zn2+ transport system ATPase subunit
MSQNTKIKNKPYLVIRLSERLFTYVEWILSSCDDTIQEHVFYLQVSQVIIQMGLKDVADSRIGSSIIRGISGGEQRRVTIAIQLLKDPGK